MNAARLKMTNLFRLAMVAVAAVLAACLLALVVRMEPSQAAFPGPNGKIAFISNRDSARAEIYTMNADGTNPTRLTNNETHDVSPTFSADGKKIAFSRENDPSIEDNNIWVMNADGSGQTNLNNPDIFSKDEGPSFSPDGSKIAFSRVLFESEPPFNYDIWVMNADGSGQTNLSNSPASEDYLPAFSPDGSKIAFETYRDGAPEIYVMNADGSGTPTNLSNNPGSSSDSTAYDRHPAWSPDGTRIAFESLRSGNSEIWVMNADGTGEPVNVSNNAAPDDYPDWQPLPPPHDFSGFFSPVDNLPTLNQAKAGSAIAVKFSLNGDQGLEIFAQNYPKSEPIACEATGSVDAIEQTASANSSGLTYDATTDQYIYVWRTNKDWRGCRQLVVKLNDDTEHRANFKFTR